MIDDVNNNKKKKPKIEENKSNDDDDDNMEDRLSSLPDVILLDILSRLPINFLPTTTILSHRWHDFWTQFTNIRIDGEVFRHALACIPSIVGDSDVNGIFEMLKRYRNTFSANRSSYPFPGIYNILRKLTSTDISLEISVPLPSLFGNAALHYHSYEWFASDWIAQAFGKGIVKKFKVSFDECYDEYHMKMLTWDVFQCQSLVELHLDQWCWWKRLSIFQDQDISLPSLNKLSLSFSHYANLNKYGLIDSCPLLEHLTLQGQYDKETKENETIDISAHNLKWLHIETTLDIMKVIQVVIYAPKLEYVYLKDYNCLSRYRFVTKPKALVTSTLLRRIQVDKVSRERKLLGAMSSVTSLTLHGATLQGVPKLNMVHHTLPTFRNLTFLNVGIKGPTHWQGLMNFLQWLPNLQVLETFGLPCQEYEDINSIEVHSLPSCLHTMVKQIRLRDLVGVKHELDIISYLLRVACVLDTLDISVTAAYVQSRETQLFREGDFCKELFKFHRSSTTCEIKICWRLCQFVN